MNGKCILYFSCMDFCQETKETIRICMWGLDVNIVPRMKTVHTKLAVMVICILTISQTVILVPLF
jgi:hypothetical protein